MTRFEIHTTYNLQKRFVYFFNTRFRPVILYGNLHDNHEDCISDMNEVKKDILSIQHISFTSNKNGYRFTINKSDGKPVAFSRFFPTQKIMNRVLLILQNHINDALMPRSISAQNHIQAA